MPQVVRDPNNIRLAMIGMVAGNGHPFSWSAIVNGEYDADAMAACGYPVIPRYLSAQPKESLGIAGVRVTHVWCDDPADAHRVAIAAKIPQVVASPLDVIGQVDAVVIPTDVGSEHLERARPFIEAGLPVFIDKPLTDRPDHLRQFIAWHAAGKPLCSTSCMRYAREFIDLRARLNEVGQPRLVVITMAKSWERYGIHALEAVYPFLPPGGWQSVANTGDTQANVVHLRHAAGVEVVIACIDDLLGAFAHVHVWGTTGTVSARFADTFFAFKQQLLAFVNFLRTGEPPVPFEQTTELMQLLMAGAASRAESGRTITIKEPLP